MPTPQKLISELDKLIEDDASVKPLVDALRDLALGVYMLEEGISGVRRVYKQPPDRQAAEYLVDRAKGKSAQAVRFVDKDNNDILSVADIELRLNNARGDKREVKK